MRKISSAKFLIEKQSDGRIKYSGILDCGYSSLILKESDEEVQKFKETYGLRLENFFEDPKIVKLTIESKDPPMENPCFKNYGINHNNP